MEFLTDQDNMIVPAACPWATTAAATTKICSSGYKDKGGICCQDKDRDCDNIQGSKDNTIAIACSPNINNNIVVERARSWSGPSTSNQVSQARSEKDVRKDFEDPVNINVRLADRSKGWRESSSYSKAAKGSRPSYQGTYTQHAARHTSRGWTRRRSNPPPPVRTHYGEGEVV